MESEEDTKRKCDPLNDDPGKETVELELVWSGIHLLDFKVVSDPQAEITQYQKGDDLATRS